MNENMVCEQLQDRNCKCNFLVCFFCVELVQAEAFCVSLATADKSSLTSFRLL